MNHPLHSLRFQLRCTQAALGTLFVACLCAAAPGARQLLLDATNQPTTDVSLASPHWTGTLPDARLSANVPLLDYSGTLAVPGSVTTGSGAFLSAFGSIWVDDGSGGWQTASANFVITGGGGYGNPNGFVSPYGDGTFAGTITAASFSGDGSQLTGVAASVDGLDNGYGSPIDNGIILPIGSLYTDQDPSGASGHTLWVMEPTGWVGH